MSKAEILLADIYKKCPDSYERRRSLLDQMKGLDSKGVNCNGCSGFCCTYQYNSMKVDPLQALELYVYLEKNNFINSNFLEKLKSTISDYRLDYEPYIGASKSLRRYYTCPLYKHGETLACPIEFEYKPYGCLAYNPKNPNTQLPDQCGSELSALELREKKFESYEMLANEKLNNFLKLNWKKNYLPVALQQIHSFFIEN